MFGTQGRSLGRPSVLGYNLDHTHMFHRVLQSRVPHTAPQSLAVELEPQLKSEPEMGQQTAWVEQLHDLQ